MIFVHGWAVNSGVWKKQVDNFSGAHTVITVDLPGHGTSQPVNSSLTIKLCGQLLASLMREKRLHSSHLVGWSLGSQVVFHTAMELGAEYVRSLTFIGGTPCYIAPTDREKWATSPTKAKYFQRRLSKDFRIALTSFIMTFFAEDNGLTPEREEEIKLSFFNENFPPDEKSAMELLESLYRDDIRPRVPELEIPCLICQGDRDMIVPGEITKLWESLLKSPKTVLFPNCGHAPFLTQPARFNSTLENFINRFS